jgi:probable rRNA maturation factor
MDTRSSAKAIQVEVQIAPAFAGSAHAPILSADRLQRVAEVVLDLEGRSGEVTLVITDDEGIGQLNRDFLGQDGPTDVLAFGVQEETGPFVAAPEAGDYLGDVIISYPRARAQAKELGHSTQRELDLLVVHGILHLLGYDHATEEDKSAMWSRQDAILSNLWV